MPLLPNKHPIACQDCALCELRNAIVDSYLPVDAEILLVGEFPSVVENREGGIPLSDAIIDDCIKATGHHKFGGKFALMNIVKCRPADSPSTYRLLKAPEIKACSEYIKAEIKSLKKLKVIVCFGTAVSGQILDKLGLTAEEYRPFTIYSREYDTRVLVTYHPRQIQLAKLPQTRNHMKMCVLETLQKAVSIAAETEPYIPITHTSKVCRNIAQVDWLFDKLNAQEYVAWDTETDGLDYLNSKILCHSFSWSPGTGVVLPILGQYNSAVWNGEEYWYIHEKVKAFLENPKVKKICQNGKFDVQQARNQGIFVQNFYADTMVMHYCVNENLDHGLKMLAWLYTDYGGYEEELDKLRTQYAKDNDTTKRESSYNLIPNEILWKYASTDPDTTLQLYLALQPILEAEGTDKIFYEMYMPFLELLARMEFDGVTIDMEYLNKTREVYRERIRVANEQIFNDPAVIKYIENKKNEYRAARKLKYETAKRTPKVPLKDYCEDGIEKITFNPGSDKQLEELFIKQLKLRVGKKTKSGAPSFDKDAMPVYAKMAPVARLIGEANKAANFLSTFLDGIHSRVRQDGRIHTSINVQVAVTGRLSSSNPNLQNVPNKTNNPEDSKLVRDIFTADSEDYVLTEFDEKQAEFRMWCEMSGDPVLKAELEAGLDIHRVIAAESFGVPEEEVTSDLRNGAKGVVFGKMYGRGNKSVAEGLGISIAHAEKIEAILFQKYKVASAWLKTTVRDAHVNKRVVNCFGFIRHLQGQIDNPDPWIRTEAERLAVNSPIQGAASQMVCYATLKLDRLFRENNIRGRLIWPIHDAILTHVHKDDLERAIPLQIEAMIHPHPDITTPLGVDGKVGKKWGTMKDAETLYPHLFKKVA